MSIWFVAEKFKQRGPDRNLYADWIILFKEQFSFRILNTENTTFWKLDVCLYSGVGVGDTYYVGSLRKSRPQSLDKIQKLNNTECYALSSESFRFCQQYSCLSP
jgi:hypothetical protein